MNLLLGLLERVNTLTTATETGLIIAILILCTLIYYYRIKILSRLINAYLCWKHPLKSTIPGNPNIPTCPYTWPNRQGDIAKFLEGETRRNEWAKQHVSDSDSDSRSGAQIYRIWNRTTPEIVLTKPEQLQLIFRDSHQHIKAVNNNTGWILGELLGQCLGLISRQKWRVLRSVTEPPFSRGAVAGYIGMIQERTRRHIEALEESDVLQTGLHPVNDLRFLPFWTVAEVIYGPLTPELEAILTNIIPVREKLFHTAIKGGWLNFSWARYLPTKTKREISRFKTDWEWFNVAALQNANAATVCNGSHEPPIVAMMLEVEKGTISKTELYQTLDEMLFANLDVTMGGLSWNLLFLASDPAQQAALRAEISHARRQEIIKLGYWDAYLQGSSTLLNACMLESARLKPLAAFSVPQAAPTDRIIGEYIIPAGANLIVDTYAINIHNPWWGADATKYRPQRFLESGRGPTEARYHYWRFGFGPRQCLGKHIANLIIRVVLVQLVEKYELGLDGQEKNSQGSWGRKPETWIMQPDLRVVCREVK